ncbi:MAG: bifunctional diguanylate cyclase/phosphodiesterase [Gammaproteobacteria bacterium]|nr:bifunctional diguanylate cyclase/phosphodiesterase [Gammaproteobacteria bacterium]
MNSGKTASNTQVDLNWAAEHWLAARAMPDDAEVHAVSMRAAQDLGRRTGYIPLAAPLTMLALLVASPQLYSHWLPIATLYLIMTTVALLRIGIARKLAEAKSESILHLARRYQVTVDLAGFSWGSLVGLILLFHGVDHVSELALVASVAITASALTSLTLELSLWRRFVLIMWLPLVTLSAAAAMQELEYGWLLVVIELLFIVFAAVQGQRVVKDYIAGILSSINLEHAVSTIATQRDELQTHQIRLDELLAQTHNLSYYDQLTGIGTRNHFYERLETNISASRINGNQFAVLYLDVDGFKDINDTLGHEAGDELLKTIACRVRSLLRASDFAARLGSDELALMVNGVAHTSDLFSIVQRYMKEVQMPVKLCEKMICPRVSIGIALYPVDGDNTFSLLKAAESAMNAAKTDTKLHYARYSPEMTIAAQQRLTIEQEMRLALSTGQFRLHYQPQVEALSGLVCGVEALVRWQHPERGLIPPNDFITVAENTGLIDELGQWVLVTACNQAARWLDADENIFSVAVNISPLQLLDRGFVNRVRSALNTTGLSPHLLELEITESAVQTHIEARETLVQLRELGVRIAIDDFGTGYSSLASLKELPIDRVKTDRVFVTDMLASERDMALLGNIIDMAHVLGCSVVAEGVEELAHVEKLQSLNCDCLQGYYFSRPVEASKIPEFARAAAARAEMGTRTAVSADRA